MENASKALIIAGSMLIAMIVVSILVWGWNRVSNYYKAEENTETIQQIFQKNKQLESYNKDVVRGYELHSLYNLIEDMNTKYAEEQGFTAITAKIKINNNEDIAQYLKNVDGLPINIIKNLCEKNDFKAFMQKYYTPIKREKDFIKIFNESYFKCDKVIYNGELPGEEGTGRVQSLEFTEIKKK